MHIISSSIVMASFLLALTHNSVAQAESAGTAKQMSIAESVFYLAESAQDAGDVHVVEGDILRGSRMAQRGIGVRPSNSVWEDGVVPYYIDPAMESYRKDIVQSAVDTWNAVAGITLVRIEPEAWDAPKDYVHFIPATGCASWVGRQGGAQAIWAGAACSKGSMIHEIGHALGLEHEHTRPDRDQYISINWDNVDAGKVDNFSIVDSERVNYGPYDYASIMHYGDYFFSANGESTITKLIDDDIRIGQRVAPSEGDIKAISMLYASDISLVSNVVNESGRTEITLLVTSESAQGANQLEIELQIGGAQLMSNNNQQWKCVKELGALSCTTDRLQGSSHASLVLLLDQELSEKELIATLVTKTPDVNMANNNGMLDPAAAKAVGSEQLYSDQQSTASAGSAGGGLLALFSLFLIVKRRVLVVLVR